MIDEVVALDEPDEYQDALDERSRPGQLDVDLSHLLAVLVSVQRTRRPPQPPRPVGFQNEQ